MVVFDCDEIIDFCTFFLHIIVYKKNVSNIFCWFWYQTFLHLKHACAKLHRDCSYSASWRSSVNLENVVSRKTLWKYLCHGQRNHQWHDQNQKVKFLRLYPQKHPRKDNPFTIIFLNEESDSCGNQFPRWHAKQWNDYLIRIFVSCRFLNTTYASSNTYMRICAPSVFRRRFFKLAPPQLKFPNFFVSELPWWMYLPWIQPAQKLG